jgi:hypothetical protein
MLPFIDWGFKLYPCPPVILAIWWHGKPGSLEFQLYNPNTQLYREHFSWLYNAYHNQLTVEDIF